MKKYMKGLVVAMLGRQVRHLRRKYQFKIIGVAGSIGKTSTKLAIAQTLGRNMRVRYQNGNYNDIVSVPLIFFGHDLPDLMNPIAWIKILISNYAQIRRNYPYDAVIVELGTDGPGQIAEFGKYLELDILVISAIAPEHMENFTDLKSVADEEISAAGYSKQVIYNADLVDPEYRGALPDGAVSYGIRDSGSDYYLYNIFHSASGLEGDIKHDGGILVHTSREVAGELQLYSSLSAVAAGHQLGLKPTEILDGLAAITPVSGRLRRLRGINSSIIIDDTYNSSPQAVKYGLEMLYGIDAPQRIAILGSMNELGQSSAAAHKEIGGLCDPAKLDLVITIGKDANDSLAAEAKNRGCTVMTFDDPYTAGEVLQGKVQQGAVVYAKGSQNGVFAEETVKKLLADPEDSGKLVRQTSSWLAKKKKQFPGRA